MKPVALVVQPTDGELCGLKLLRQRALLQTSCRLCCFGSRHTGFARRVPNSLRHWREISHRVDVRIDQVQLAAAGKLSQHVTLDRTKPFAIDRVEATELYLLAGRQGELSFHRLKELEVFQLLNEAPRRAELRLIGLQESENALQILRSLSRRIKQPLPETLLVQAREGFIDAKRERVSAIGAGKDKRILANERRNVFSGPCALPINESIFAVSQTEQSHGHDRARFACKHDRIFEGCRLELGGHQRHRVHFARI